MKVGWIAALLVAVGVLGCGGKSKPPMSADNADESDASSTDLPEGAFAATISDGGAAAAGDEGASSSESGGGAPAGSEESARTLLKKFVEPNADHAALTKSLRPASADYKAMFDTQTAANVEAAQAKDWDSGAIVIKPKNAKQSEVKVWGATGADLASGGGNAKEFPGGYKKIGPHLAPTVTFYAFKFVQPGREVGMEYDGLVFVNGHWVVVPKPWRGVEGAGAGGDAHPAGKAHKNGKKKKKKK